MEEVAAIIFSITMTVTNTGTDRVKEYSFHSWEDCETAIEAVEDANRNRKAICTMRIEDTTAGE